MRAAIILWLGLVTVAGCGASDGSGAMPPPPTGLVLELHFDHNNVMQVALNGATSATSRRFGPYLVAEKDLPHDSTVGFVFDARDAGTAMVCAESRDMVGKVLASACDNFDIVAAQVTHDSLTLVDPNNHY